MILDLDELVASGTCVRWIDAQHQAETARKQYRTRVDSSLQKFIAQQKKMLTSNVASLKGAACPRTPMLVQ